MPKIDDKADPPADERGEALRGPAANADETRGVCWVCGAAVNERHCKIICPRCGFMRDCSDP